VLHLFLLLLNLPPEERDVELVVVQAAVAGSAAVAVFWLLLTAIWTRLVAKY
jgi:hypothetical protein